MQRNARIFGVCRTLVPLLALALPVPAQATRWISAGVGGAAPDGDLRVRGVRGDGGLVLCDSSATNLVADDDNGARDVFLLDPDGGPAFLVSRGTGGAPGNGDSQRASLSDDGRHVAFVSAASDLVVGDTNGRDDVFVHDRVTGATVRVSVKDDGSQLRRASNWSAVSDDGRHVAFDSSGRASPDDANTVNDVFVRDRDPDGNGVFDEGNGRTVRVSVSALGAVEDAGSYFPRLSGDGRRVTFHSDATNLVAGDTNGRWDVFLHDRDPDGNGLFDEGNGRTTRLSVSSGGVQSDGDSRDAVLSRDGAHAAFWSQGTNLVPGDANGSLDAFVHELATGRTVRVSVTSAGLEANGDSRRLGLSGDGRLVVFRSLATNLVPGDTNGTPDLFLHDRDPDGNGLFDEGNGSTERLSLSSFDDQSSGDHDHPRLSSNGRFVALGSDSPNLVPGRGGAGFEAFRRDLLTLRATLDGSRLVVDVERAFGHEGRPVLVLPSLTGTRPGFTVPDTGLLVPLVPDEWTRSARARPDVYRARIGPDGRARLGALPGTGWGTLHLAAVLLSPAGAALASSPPRTLTTAARGSDG